MTHRAEVPSVDRSREIVLTGQGRWCEELAAGLEEYCGLRVGLAPFDRVAAALDLAAWRCLARARVVVVVGFRPGARTIRGRLFDAAFSVVRGLGPQKRVIYYWIGSDVQRALHDVREGGGVVRTAARSQHFAGSAELAEELAEVGLSAEVVEFPWRGIPESARPLPMPSAFTVLSYVPDARWSFYGGPQLIEAARALPSVEFLIVGGSGTWIEAAPDNVRFLGWQEDMRPWYEASSCVVRMVEHDAVGGTVVEALAYGRRVVYSRILERTTNVPFGDVQRLVAVLGSLAESYSGESAQPDLEASAWALHHYDPKRLFGALAEQLQDASATSNGGAARAG